MYRCEKILNYKDAPIQQRIITESCTLWPQSQHVVVGRCTVPCRNARLLDVDSGRTLLIPESIG